MMKRSLFALPLLVGVTLGSSAVAETCPDERRWPWSDRKTINAALRSEYLQLHASHAAMNCSGRPSVLTGAETYCAALADRLAAIHHELQRNHLFGKRVTACGPEGSRPPLALESVAAEDVPAEAPARRAKAQEGDRSPESAPARPQVDRVQAVAATDRARPAPRQRRGDAGAQASAPPPLSPPPSPPQPQPPPSRPMMSAAPAAPPPARPIHRQLRPAGEPASPRVPKSASLSADAVMSPPPPPPRLEPPRVNLAHVNLPAPEPPMRPAQPAPARPRAPEGAAERSSPSPAPELAPKASIPLPLFREAAAAPDNIGAGYVAAVSAAGVFALSQPPIAPAGSPVRKRFMAKGGRFACVRSCDGFYFPLNQSVRGGDAQDMCASLCPGARTEAFRLPAGGGMADATSMSGERYGSLRAAFLYRRSVNPGCGCKVPGQSWEALLRPAERVLASPHGDKILDEQTADRLSRAQLRAKLRAEAAQEAAAGAPPPASPQPTQTGPARAAQRTPEARPRPDPAETGSIRASPRR